MTRKTNKRKNDSSSVSSSPEESKNQGISNSTKTAAGAVVKKIKKTENVSKETISEIDKQVEFIVNPTKISKIIEPTATSSSSSSLATNESPKVITKGKSKPIIVDCDNKVASNILNDRASKLTSTATVQNSTNGRSMIQCGSKADKVEVIKLLKHSNLQFHTFAEKDEKSQVYILKGLSGYSDAEVNDLLTQNIKDYTLKVTRISKADSPHPVFRVLFQGNKINVEFLQHNHRFIGYLKVSWEKIRQDHKRPTQCFRCQGWGHTTLGCNRNFKCVKCAGDHEPGKCQRKNRDDDSVPLKCANCGGNHPANFTDCEKRKVFLLKSKKATHQPPPKSTKPIGTTNHQKPQCEDTTSFPPLPSTCSWGSTTTINKPVSAEMRNPEKSSSLEVLIQKLSTQISSLEKQIENMKADISFLKNQRSSSPSDFDMQTDNDANLNSNEFDHTPISSRTKSKSSDIFKESIKNDKQHLNLPKSQTIHPNFYSKSPDGS